MVRLTRAQRELCPPPPAPRNRWRCPTCGAEGASQNAHAAYLAGTRHYVDVHDDPRRTTRCRSGHAADDECQDCRLVGFFDAPAPGSPGSFPCVSDPAEP